MYTSVNLFRGVDWATHDPAAFFYTLHDGLVLYTWYYCFGVSEHGRLSNLRVQSKTIRPYSIFSVWLSGYWGQAAFPSWHTAIGEGGRCAAYPGGIDPVSGAVQRLSDMFSHLV